MRKQNRDTKIPGGNYTSGYFFHPSVIWTVRTEYTAHSNIFILPPNLLKRIAVVFLFFFLYQFHDSLMNVLKVTFFSPHFEERCQISTFLCAAFSFRILVGSR